METATEKGKRKWESFRSGFSSTSVLALLYAMILFVPAQIYLTLMTGAGAATASWFTLLLWVELGKLSGKHITKQEGCMILVLTGAAVLYPITLIYTAWYRTSPQAALFDIGPQIPDWAAPAPETGVLELRTFIHPAWILPIGVSLASIVLGRLLSFGLGLFGREVFIETERLPFPIQQISGSAVMTLTEGKREPLRLLSVFALVGFFYGFLLYAAPFLIQAGTGRYIEFIPLPWVDLNEYVGRALPGANFGIFTDLWPISSGIVLGLPTVLGFFIGSFAAYFFGSWLSVAYNLVDVDPVKPGVQSWWVPGMSISLAWQRYLMFFFMPILVGMGLAVGLGPILRRPGTIRRAFSPARSREAERLTDPMSRVKVMVPLTAAGLGGLVALCYVLVPNFVEAYLWFIPLMVVMPFLTTLILGRMIGETGVGSWVGADNLRNLVYYVSGYPGVDVWFAPTTFTLLGTETISGAATLRWFKVAELTETRSASLIKMYWFVFPLAVLVGYVFMEIFWNIAPIPSGRYPGIAISWDIQATVQSLWIRGRITGLLTLFPILVSFIMGTGIYLALDFLHVPISFVALGAGVGTITPVAVTMLIGALIARVLRRALGKEWMDKNKLIIGAGLMMGESIAITIGLSVAIIINAIWISPF